MPRTGIFTFFAVASFAVSFALNRNAASGLHVEAPKGPTAAVPAAGVAGMLTAPDLQRQTQASMASIAGVPGGPDTTGLLQEALTIDGLLDAVNADIADGFTPVDRVQFKAQLESDPELRKSLAD